MSVVADMASVGSTFALRLATVVDEDHRSASLPQPRSLWARQRSGGEFISPIFYSISEAWVYVSAKKLTLLLSSENLIFSSI